MDAPTPFKVIIIGAGISGLSCAEQLMKGAEIRDFPIEILILEGRDRVGGRLHTIRTNEGSYIDLGASWIHGFRGNPVSELADKFKIPRTAPRTSFQPWSERTFDATGFVFPPEMDQDMDELVEEYLHGSVFVKAESYHEDISVHEAVQKFGYRHIIETIQNKYAQELEGKDPKCVERLFWLKVKNFEGYNGGSSANLSAKHFLDWYLNFSGGDRYIVGGYANISEGLTRILKDKGATILTSRVVETIAFDEESKQVKVSGMQTDPVKIPFDFTGDCVVVTVPLGVLKSSRIQFSPPLPSWKTECIQRMGMGLLDKIVLTFNEPFWSSEDEWIGFASDQYLDFRIFLNLQFYTKNDNAILVAFAHDEFACELESLPDEEVFQRALKVLARCYGDQVFKLFKYGLITRWNSDPFSFGAYSYMAYGSSGKDFELLGEPLIERRTFFAGEATSRKHLGTVHGGLISGRREAERIMQSFFPPIAKM